MKKILQVGKFYPILGGVEKVMWDLMVSLNGAGVSCDMLCAMASGEKVYERDAEAAGDHLITCRAWAKAAGTMIAPSMIFWLRRHCKEYDIVHIHHPDPMAALALRLSGYKGGVVLHWHSDIISQKFGLSLYLPLQKWLVRRAAVVVGTTPVYLEESPYLRDCTAPKIAVPIGIEPVPCCYKDRVEQFRDRYAGKKLVLAVGRLVPYKDYGCLISALSRLPEEYSLVIVGCGPLMGDLVDAVERAGVKDRVVFRGRVGDDELQAWMWACDVLALTSWMKTEAFGIVQIEAFSCGKPVVSTRIPGSGVSWVNEDGVSGLTVPVGDPEAVAAAIRRVCEEPGLKEKLGAGARERYESLFTVDGMRDKIIKIYEDKFGY